MAWQQSQWVSNKSNDKFHVPLWRYRQKPMALISTYRSALRSWLAQGLHEQMVFVNPYLQHYWFRTLTAVRDFLCFWCLFRKALYQLHDSTTDIFSQSHLLLFRLIQRKPLVGQCHHWNVSPSIKPLWCDVTFTRVHNVFYICLLPFDHVNRLSLSHM